MFGRLLTVKTLIRAALTALSIANIGVAHAHFVSTADVANTTSAKAIPAWQAGGHILPPGDGR